uniref:VWFA domain-containing protein n=1 Tax=Periophthalmus magnuspinnatus TaxID=409849 RepID=A0A3B4AM47_9GOBI
WPPRHALLPRVSGGASAGLSRPMELVFVIDSSESVGPENFEIIKDFVNALVDRVTVGRNATRIGLVLYSLEVKLVFNLARYVTKQDIKQAIRNIPYMGEGTYTGTAIRKATQDAFYSSRTGVSKVAIVITDGQTDKREPVKLDIAVREAHAANIEMFALGIVNTSDPTQGEFLRELNLIASDPDSEVEQSVLSVAQTCVNETKRNHHGVHLKKPFFFFFIHYHLDAIAMTTGSKLVIKRIEQSLSSKIILKKATLLDLVAHGGGAAQPV